MSVCGQLSIVTLGTAAEPTSCGTTLLVEACDESWVSKKLLQTVCGVQAQFIKVLQSIYGDGVHQADLNLGFC